MKTKNQAGLVLLFNKIIGLLEADDTEVSRQVEALEQAGAGWDKLENPTQHMRSISALIREIGVLSSWMGVRDEVKA